jgi:hypothetical protein
MSSDPPSGSPLPATEVERDEILLGALADCTRWASSTWRGSCWLIELAGGRVDPMAVDALARVVEHAAGRSRIAGS